MSRFQVLSDAQWSLIEDELPHPTGRRGRPFADARTMVEAIVYRYRTGIAWRDLPREVFGPRCSSIDFRLAAASAPAVV